MNTNQPENQIKKEYLFEDDNLQTTNPGMARMGKIIPLLLGGFALIIDIHLFKGAYKIKPLLALAIFIPLTIGILYVIQKMYKESKQKYGLKKEREWVSISNTHIEVHNSNIPPIALKSIVAIFYLLKEEVYLFTNKQYAQEAEKACIQLGKLSILNKIFLMLTSTDKHVNTDNGEYVAKWCSKRIRKKYGKNKGTQHIHINSIEQFEQILLEKGFINKELHVNNKKGRIMNYYGTILKKE